jgi:tetratricopeptide (TPR) repeat protein
LCAGQARAVFYFMPWIAMNAAQTKTTAATRADRTFADAWYNLSDLLDEQGRVEAAIECLRTVLRVAPAYGAAVSAYEVRVSAYGISDRRT